MAIQYQLTVRSKRSKQRAENLRAYRESLRRPSSGNFALTPLARDIAKDCGISEQEAIDFLMGWAELVTKR